MLRKTHLVGSDIITVNKRLYQNVRRRRRRRGRVILKSVEDNTKIIFHGHFKIRID